jgi:formiminotetrahydrofolate cyclodeaminase
VSLAADLPSREESFGAGPAAAIALALAARVVAQSARQSVAEWEEAPAVVAQAEALRRRALSLAGADLAAHTGARGALAAARDEAGSARAGPPLGPALVQAAAVPLQIAEAGADVASLAALTAERCAPDGRADAAGAALIASGAVDAAAHLLEVNLSIQQDDERLEQARELIGLCRDARERATAATR